MNDLDVFNEDDAPQQQKLAIVEPKKNRAPSYYDFQPLLQKLLKLGVRTTAEKYLERFGATIKLNREPKAPTITGLTWEHVDKINAHIAALEAKAKPPAKAEKPAAQKAKPAAAPEQTGRTVSQRKKEGDRLLKLALKKGYAKEDLQRAIDHFTEDGSWTETALLEFDKYVQDLEDVSPAGQKKAAKEKAEKQAADLMEQLEDRIGTILDKEIRNAKNGKVYTVRKVLKRLAIIKSLQETRAGEYEAEKRQLESSEIGWKLCYGGTICGLLIDEFEARRIFNEDGTTKEFRPATIVLGWLTAKRKPIKAWPKCTDKERFAIWVEDELVKKPEVRQKIQQSLTPEQNSLFQKCFKKGVFIDYDMVERAYKAGVPFPYWMIPDADDIGEPELYFSKPRDKKAPASLDVEEIDEEEFDDV